MLNHVGIQVATFTRVDLKGTSARGANAIRIVIGLLVAFNDGSRETFVGRQGTSQEFGLARARRGDHIEC